MRKTLLFSLLLLALTASATKPVRVEGTKLIQPNGKELRIRGTNLGNWLNPEGYMFGFRRTNCEWMINQMIAEAAGPDFAREFWREFKDNYITRADIDFIAREGANTIRLPFNYKLFTREDYMGLNDDEEGFRRMDSVVSWCRANKLYLILDMHDCPGGQTGDNIDNGYGYPWLFTSEASQQQFIQIWTRIARHYKDEPVILGYELMNEPIATMFPDKEEINRLLEPLYKRAVEAIRQVDPKHIILLGGAQWNSNFGMLGEPFDPQLMYTCHRYGGEPTAEAIQHYIDTKQRTGRPMYMGEIGHNTDEWQHRFVETMRQQGIGYTFWPYKKIENSCMAGIVKPEQWDSVVVKFAEADRSSFDAIRKNRPDQALFRRLMLQYVRNAALNRCIVQRSYIESMELKKK